MGALSNVEVPKIPWLTTLQDKVVESVSGSVGEDGLASYMRIEFTDGTKLEIHATNCDGYFDVELKDEE